MSEIKMDCPYCGCDKEKIHKVNCGPIIRIRCPECGYTISRGYDDINTWDSLISRWNMDMIWENGNEKSLLTISTQESEESAVRSAFDIIRYCKSIKNCQDCIFVKATSYRKTFHRCPFNDGGKEPKDWNPPFLDIFDSIQNYTQF